MKLPNIEKSFLTCLFLLAALSLAGCGSPKPSNNTQKPNVNNYANIPSGRFYFHAPGCSHCDTVAAYAEEQKTHQRFYYIEQMVGNGGSADMLLKAIAARCRISETSLSVPLFWDGSRCYMGSDEVIGFFKSNAN